VNETFVGGR